MFRYKSYIRIYRVYFRYDPLTIYFYFCELPYLPCASSQADTAIDSEK